MGDFDLARALVTGFLIFLTLVVARRLGWVETGQKRWRWSWRVFWAGFAVALIVNIVWELF